MPDPPRVAAMPDAKIDELLQSSHPEWYEAALKRSPPVHEAALGLAQAAVQILVEQKAEGVSESAEAICAYIRQQSGAPIFASRPKARFQKNWMVSGYGFRCYAHVCAHILPKFERDIGHLPEHGVGADADRIEVGRLIMISIWRLGFACKNHLDVLLQRIASDAPMLAVGELRLLVLEVQAQRTRESMRRTALIEPFSAIYLTVERTRLRRILGPLVSLNPDRRPRRWEAAMRAYLRSIDAPADITLAGMMAAATQSLMLKGSPILAAYSSGEIFTEDLNDAEFRRLAGLQPTRPFDTEGEPLSEQESEEPLSKEMPADIAGKRWNFASRLCGFSSSRVDDWKAEINAVVATTPAERLLKAYALWLLDGYAKEGEQGEGASTEDTARRELTTRNQSLMRKRIEVVGHGLLGFVAADDGCSHIDELIVEALVDHTAAHFPIKMHHGAWSRFRTYLSDEAADKAGFTVGKIISVSERWISAKILSAIEISRIKDRLRSVRSGIGTGDNRVSARRHFSVTEQIGGRRGEVAMQRSLDVEGELARIQRYDNHSLKTPAADRVYPLMFLESDARTIVEEGPASGRGKLIDAFPGHDASGDNFFHRLVKTMKEVTGDQDIGLHHLRHTKPSGLVLSMLDGAINLSALNEDLPWVEGLLVEKARRDVLLGHESQAGQGMQAITMLLGHLHTTTTLRHYVHTLCIALYAFSLNLPKVGLARAFENRLLSRATLYLWATQCRKGCAKAADPEKRARLWERMMRDRIETAAQALLDADQSADVADGEKSLPKAKITLVHHDATLIRIEEADPIKSAAAESDALSFELIESFDQWFRTGTGPIKNADALRRGLHAIASIPSGKLGSTSRRHPMPDKAFDETPLPKAIVSGDATKNADELIRWLEQVRTQDAESFEWLMSKWLTATDAQQGLMRLDGEQDMKRVMALPVSSKIMLKVEESPITKSRRDLGWSKSTQRLRILCVASKPSRGDRKKKTSIRRSAGPVRWAMTWVAAISSVSDEHEDQDLQSAVGD